MELELCPSCRSWRVTLIDSENGERYQCQECTAVWTVVPGDRFVPRTDGESLDNQDPE